MPHLHRIEPNPFDRDIVFYCTCQSDGTSREMVRRAHKAKHTRVKFLRGGLAGWKEKGFAIETYETVFHLSQEHYGSLRLLYLNGKFASAEALTMPFIEELRYGPY